MTEELSDKNKRLSPNQILLVVVLLGASAFLFWWLQVRPISIKQSCFEANQVYDQHFDSETKKWVQLSTKHLVEDKYNECLLRNGLDVATKDLP